MEASLRKYPLMTHVEIRPFIKEMIDLEVSEVARSRRGFLSNYFHRGPQFLKAPSLGPTGNPSPTTPWWKKRENFIKRHLAQYKINKTYRRKLALIAWAYLPK